MLGDIEPQPNAPEQVPAWQPVTPPPVIPPAPTYIPAKPRSSPLPILFGFLIVIVVAAAIGIAYYKAKLTSSITPTPTPSATVSPSIEPSASPSTSPSASPKSSVKPVGKSSAIPTTKPTVVPSSSLNPAPTLDIRFGNPSANVKQTFDDGSDDGRVINREYTSIQVGEFDELSSTWSPRVTVCFHFVSNENINSGKDLKYRFSVDDKVSSEGDMGQYEKIEAGRLYDMCQDVTTDVGVHTAKLTLNPEKSLRELTYVNDLARLEWKNLTDQIAPNYTLIGPNDEGDAGTCLLPQYISDNVTSYANLKIEQKIDNSDWSKFDGDRYCFKGNSGDEHAFAIKITDARGNANEQKRTFVLY